MTQSDLTRLKNQAVFLKDYRGRPLLSNPAILMNTKASIVNLIDDMIEAFRSKGERIEILCLFEAGGHTSNSQHYKGQACDFHFVNSKLSYFERLLLVENVLQQMGAAHAVGLGYYPRSRSESFHVDTRGEQARWCGVFYYYGNGMYSVDYDTYSYHDGLKLIGEK